VNPEPQADEQQPTFQPISQKNTKRLKVLGLVLTVAGIGLFSYFVYSVGVDEIAASVGKFGWAGFGIILLLYLARMMVRAGAWSMSVFEPYSLSLKDTIPAVIIGEALSTMIPLGILVSGTAKAVAVRKRVPLVVGLSSVATENLFYSFVTSTFLIVGAFIFVRTFDLDPAWVVTIDVLIAAIVVIFVFLVLLVVRQWHFASETCEWLYQKGIGRGIFEHGRLQVRLFENFIYAFYRNYPRRFLPIVLCEAAYHVLGIAEVWLVLSRITDATPSLLSAFLLESVSRLLTIVFKLVPFLIGIDEAGAQFVTKTVAMGATIGVTLAIVRKGRILFWTAVGIILIAKRGLSVSEITGGNQPSTV
jgi:hypothetical protein